MSSEDIIRNSPVPAQPPPAAWNSSSTSGSTRHDPCRDRGSSPLVSDEIHIPMFNRKDPAFTNITKVLSSCKSFSISSLKRASKNIMINYSMVDEEDSKPHALDIEKLFSKVKPILVHGTSNLKNPTLNADQFDILHMKHCDKCRVANTVLPTCYGATLGELLRKGWNPRRNREKFCPLYNCSNSPMVTLYAQAAKINLNKQIVADTVRVASKDEWNKATISPISLVIKKADRFKLAAVSTLKVINDRTLEEANKIMMDNNMAVIKTRPITNLTGSGVNDAYDAPRFSNMVLDDAIKMVSQNCFIGIFDAASYYEQFKFATEFVKEGNLAFKFEGTVYTALAILFGFCLAPAFCAVFTSELVKWANAREIPTVAYNDDWLTVGDDESGCKDNMITLINMYQQINLVFPEKKRQLGQVVLYIGFVINTIKMTISLDAEGVKHYLHQIQTLQDKIRKNQRVTMGELNSMAGKFNHYSNVFQEGRVHIRSLWLASNDFDNLYKYRSQLLSDLNYWKKVLRPIADKTTPNEFKIFNADSILADPSLCTIMRSDASGLVTSNSEGNGGYGYIFGDMSESNPRFKAGRWNDDYAFGPSSHFGELSVLKIFLDTDAVDNKLLLWVTDCASAVWSINKGYSKSEESFTLLSQILKKCDEMKIMIVAFWWPREEGDLEDYLTHLSAYLNRDFISGRVSELGRIPVGEGREGDQGHQRC